MDSQDGVESDPAGDPPGPGHRDTENSDPEALDPSEAALLAEIRAAYERHDPVPPGLAERTTPTVDTA